MSHKDAKEIAMHTHGEPGKSAHTFEIRFASLFIEGRGYAFPCDEQGQVDMDRLSASGRCNFFFARAMVGREFSLPIVLPAWSAHICAASSSR